MFYSIKEFGQILGLTQHTLRYYEKEALLKPTRSHNGYRVYSERDVEWMQFILRLKKTGMSIKQIKLYAQLLVQGDSTVHQRKKILEVHEAYIHKRIHEWQEHQQNLQQKIKFYDEMCGCQR